MRLQSQLPNRPGALGVPEIRRGRRLPPAAHVDPRKQLAERIAEFARRELPGFVRGAQYVSGSIPGNPAGCHQALRLGDVAHVDDVPQKHLREGEAGPGPRRFVSAVPRQRLSDPFLPHVVLRLVEDGTEHMAGHVRDHIDAGLLAPGIAILFGVHLALGVGLLFDVPQPFI